MTSEFISNRISDVCKDYDVIILKGFSVPLIKELSSEYQLLDENIFSNDKIHLEGINSSQTLYSVLQPIQGKKQIMTIESFLNIIANMRNISMFGKRFCVLTNNLLRYYENPSDINIPDFESNSFQEAITENSIFGLYYSYCIHENGTEYIEYIDYELDDEKGIAYKNLVDGVEIPSDKIKQTNSRGNYQFLSNDDDSIDRLLKELYYKMSAGDLNYIVSPSCLSENKIKILYGTSLVLGVNLHFYVEEKQDYVNVRKELYNLLKSTWGYDSFRCLSIYNNLEENHDVREVSQGEVIETVVQQSEAALNHDARSMKNILLTAPTGAGKSLLFQLAAIYLGEKYGALTIVVSPLVALMNDQVENLQKKYPKVATINGNKTLIEKEQILEAVRDGSVHILYLAPELLLSYTLDSFVGGRTIGLFVVDEAHTVTTWGRDFRVDYWFLGDYIRSSRRWTNQHFPIFALTATAVYDPTGGNDMVFDTIRSLYMDPCIKFIGVVRRDNISFEINNVTLEGTYDHARLAQTSKRIIESIKKERKTIFYFPFVRQIYQMTNHESLDNYKSKIACYHSDLTRREKEEYAANFKSGKSTAMCATKAYGMGIDVSDIEVVYHHAPNGSLSDYVQEIGRVARKEGVQGTAMIDFSPKDFKYSRKLHGLSAIKTYQLREVLKKLMALHRLKGEKQNMLITADDFEYIFSGKEVDYDQKVKSSLMLISSDLQQKYGYPVLIVRPKNVFSKMFIRVENGKADAFYRAYKKYLTHIEGDNNMFLLDSDKLWERKYRDMSFPKFKREIAMNNLFGAFSITILNKLSIRVDNVSKTINNVHEFFNQAHTFLNYMSVERKRISTDKMKEQLPSNWKTIKKDAFVDAFKLVYTMPFENDKKAGNAICKIYTESSGKESFQLIEHAYETLESRYIKAFAHNIHNEEEEIYAKPKDDIVRVAELLSSLDIADYERLGGESPSIFVRLNNPGLLFRLSRNEKYQNTILNNIYHKYEFSEKVFTYFFTNKMTNKMRWDFIEAYFLGETEDKLLSWVEDHK